jgi:acetyltransferase-like isoleucine patch superfamily enzyme
MSIADKIKSDPRLKKIAHRLLIPSNEHRPRWWVRTFLNPFIHQFGKGCIVRRRTRMDILPFNKFALGNKSVIEDFVTINNGVGDVIIGNGSTIGMGNVIIGPIHIGSNVIFAQNIVASGLNHGYEDVTVPPVLQKVTTKQIIVEDDVWVGANSTITAGVTIGKHCVVGAGSVVTKSLPSYSVAVGNPARVIKKFDFDSQEWVKV